MKKRTVLIGVAMAGGIFAVVCVMNRPKPERAAQAQPKAELVAPAPIPSPAPAPAEPAPAAVPESAPAPAPEPVKPGSKPTMAQSALSGQGGATGKEAPAQDPAAREALSWVGVDPDAEDYWVDAINDPSLPADERQNLIEDLNEDGLSDPKHPGPEDLPVIMNRIWLINQLRPFAMDQVNFDAFNEAEKDLWNLRAIAAGDPSAGPVN